MITKCINWIKQSALRADEYYRAMTQWVTSRRSKGSIKGLLTLALAYDKALDKVLVCLRKLKPSKAVDNEIADTKEYKSMLSDDIRLLHKIEE